MTRSLLFLAALLASPAKAQAFPVTVQSCDREITVEAPPRRAVSNDVNLTEMMLALGLQDRMAGHTGISDARTVHGPLQAALAEIPELSPRYPGREVLLGANADFYFAGWNYGMSIGGEVTPDRLAPFGITVYELAESCIHVMEKPRASLDDLYTDIRNLGAIFGVSERAEALIAGWRAELAALSDAIGTGTPPRVFVYDSGEDTPYTAGRYAMPTALIEAAGGVNIMQDFGKSWAMIGWEEVIARDPEVIVIVDYGEVTAAQKRDFLTSNPALAGLTAIREDNFVILDYVAATPGPRNIEAVGLLARAFAGAVE
ncbi:ABC transporter substrate-binding protein [Limimaricola cinnabarinus]|jgi:iron complex transport system substrate-binding protein|uniref:Iron ABC transporter substrate-binding protein n=1 Tax=Limimaricola cinnabarinus TaxID=1125964 RepID=A0A2G1MG53_9RHOB|nr:ABC transporter substrate-binding protein [Limimaricola cinnabarinus]PHP27674.1 iron ABC transporter substrate-binding protein [Limimaricola cinnabarinus]